MHMHSTVIQINHLIKPLYNSYKSFIKFCVAPSKNCGMVTSMNNYCLTINYIYSLHFLHAISLTKLMFTCMQIGTIACLPHIANQQYLSNQIFNSIFLYNWYLLTYRTAGNFLGLNFQKYNILDLNLQS